MENKENVVIDSQEENKNEQRGELLNTSETPTYELSLKKRIILFLIGTGGLFIFSLILSIAFYGLPKEQFNANANFVTYALLFVSLFLVIVVDIPKLLFHFKTWWKYLVGIGFAFGIVMFTIVYSAIVNLFYKSSVNDNEAGIRSITTLYPIASIFIFGIVGPICEELTYRVGLFGSLKRLNKILAYAVTTIIFALMHFGFTSKDIINELVNLPVYIISGLALTVCYDYFGFAASVTAHISNNIYALLMTIAASYLTN